MRSGGRGGSREEALGDSRHEERMLLGCFGLHRSPSTLISMGELLGGSAEDQRAGEKEARQVNMLAVQVRRASSIPRAHTGSRVDGGIHS